MWKVLQAEGREEGKIHLCPKAVEVDENRSRTSGRNYDTFHLRKGSYICCEHVVGTANLSVMPRNDEVQDQDDITMGTASTAVTASNNDILE